MEARNLTDRQRCCQALGVAALLFTALFGGLVFHFWLQLAASVLALVALAFRGDPAGMRGLVQILPARAPAALLGGALAAAALYGIFAVGGWAAPRILPQAGPQIGAVYALRGAAPGWAVSALLLGIIGPGEEIFWRGYVQRVLTREYGWKGLALAVLAYGAVHLASGNPMLVLAALVCGGFWALLFLFVGSLWVNMLSHALWGVTVFVLRPLA